jgi:hypothetical protein
LQYNPEDDKTKQPKKVHIFLEANINKTLKYTNKLNLASPKSNLMTDPTKILIRMPNWLGDLMMATAFCRAVLERFPEATVDLIVRKGFEGLPLPHRGTLLPFDRELTKAGDFGAELA